MRNNRDWYRHVYHAYYLKVMRKLREAIRQKRPDLLKNRIWLLHHDNTSAHTSLLVREFLAKNNTLVIPQPPYSPDLSRVTFLFSKLRRPMKGDKDGIEGGGEQDHKKLFFEVLRGLKKTLTEVYNSWWELL